MNLACYASTKETGNGGLLIRRGLGRRSPRPGWIAISCHPPECIDLQCFIQSDLGRSRATEQAVEFNLSLEGVCNCRYWLVYVQSLLTGRQQKQVFVCLLRHNFKGVMWQSSLQAVATSWCGAAEEPLRGLQSRPWTVVRTGLAKGRAWKQKHNEICMDSNPELKGHSAGQFAGINLGYYSSKKETGNGGFLIRRGPCRRSSRLGWAAIPCHMPECIDLLCLFSVRPWKESRYRAGCKTST